MARSSKITAVNHEAQRAKIKTTKLLLRLQDNALGEIELSKERIRSIEILLKKTIPDLSSVTVAGDKANPLSVIVTGVERADDKSGV